MNYRRYLLTSVSLSVLADAVEQLRKEWPREPMPEPYVTYSDGRSVALSAANA